MTKDDDREPGLTNTSPGPVAVNALPGYLLLYIALYSAYGTESAYLPAFLGYHGLSNEQIGLVLAAGTVVRIVAGPLTVGAGGHLVGPQQGVFIDSFFSPPIRVC